MFRGMNFAWDPEKSEVNLRERGFDFEFASRIFDGPTLEKEDRRHDYGRCESSRWVSLRPCH